MLPRRLGRWRLDEALGPGTFAGVETASGDRVVVKVAAAGAPPADRLREEAAALRSLGGGGHPALVVAAGELDDGAVVAVASARVEGVPLDQLLATGGPLGWVDAACTLAPVGEALADLHRCGWVHGDVSPANVVVGPAGAVLVDLGSAHRSHDRPPPAATPVTAAPEVRRGESATTAADVWALAALVAVAATGEPPTAGSPMPATVALGLQRALAADPTTRPDVARLADTLRSLGRRGKGVAPALDADTVARSERPTRDFGPRPVRPIAVPASSSAHRRRWPYAVAAAVVVAAAALGWGLSAPKAPAGPAAPPPDTACPVVPPLAGQRLDTDVDGDGCTDAAGWRDGVLTVRLAVGGTPRRYAVGRTGQTVLLEDGDGDGLATPAVFDPATGTTTRYRWPTPAPRGG